MSQSSINVTKGKHILLQWLHAVDKAPFPFQQNTRQAYLRGESGLLNAPTGCGKTYALFIPALIYWINRHPANWQDKKNNGLQLLWITPLRALAKDLQRAMQEVCDGISLPWQVGMRSGDVTAAEKAKQKKQMPEVLIITPESLHLLLAQKNNAALFENLQAVVIDEWHELLGSKRGVQVELALTRLKAIRRQQLRVWAISATIGNLEQAMEAALGHQHGTLIKADIQKQTEVFSILPPEIEKLPWAGHLGIKMVKELLPVIAQSNTTLLFTNTRAQSEIWFHALLDAEPELAGTIALHHGSIDTEVRKWVEDALHQGILKVVVCTSSLDLGVDFRPVDTVIQVGSPKGVARFLQRAGRSGHSPFAISRIYFLPTHSLELVEAAALKQAIQSGMVEKREPVMLAYDVLIQYLVTLAVGDGFVPGQIYEEVKSSFSYRHLTPDEWGRILSFITTGGTSLSAYDEFKRVEIDEGVYRVKSRKMAMRHRLHIGTIVSDAVLKVRFMKGGFIGTMEEWSISRLKPGDVFTLAGKIVEMVMVKDMEVLVKKSKQKKANVLPWMGGRMSLSANLGEALRHMYHTAAGESPGSVAPEMKKLQPLFELQKQLSHVPGPGETLMEYIVTKDGHHLFVYPFEGRLVHEVMAALIAYRLSLIEPITFSIAMSDYGFELLSDREIPLHKISLQQLFSTQNLLYDIQRSLNAAEMARRKFRDIAVIAGLVFQGYPGAYKKDRHLQSGTSLLFKVFADYDPQNLLLQQAYREVFDQQFEEVRLREALQRMAQSTIIIKYPKDLTPFSFPIKVDSLNRENLSSEKLEDRVKRLQQQVLRNIKK